MALIPPSSQEPAPRWRVPRIAAVGLVGVLHAAFVVFILTSQPDTIVAPPLPHETYLFFKPAPPPPRLPVRIEPAQTARRAKPLFRYEPSTAITLPAPVEHALELALFKCNPENLARLSPEDRTKCGVGVAMSSYRSDAGESAPDPGRWNDAFAARKADRPDRCSYIGRSVANPASGETEPIAGLDLACAARELFDADTR